MDTAETTRTREAAIRIMAQSTKALSELGLDDHNKLVDRLNQISIEAGKIKRLCDKERK